MMSAAYLSRRCATKYLVRKAGVLWWAWHYPSFLIDPWATPITMGQTVAEVIDNLCKAERIRGKLRP